ncbi:hypothetical protein GURKE_01420 [Brevundimonas phage vB_BpoS-Gurke]|uniref:Uncharacterized protein n=1 Tax=Brevundimonas phage vB_BpoS-Gurke TaxID=2948599 RepID=A0A9E7SQI0_9CAUD|nr:hypothetical protein GURKE_01420 [Brevundimonas phage vB_BpoS-Gurke]
MTRTPTKEFDQRQWDYDAMTAIAAFLSDNPAAPFSGRQCAEFIQDARDRLYGGVTVWNRLIDQPPGKFGDQVDVIFCGEDWGWPMWGMVDCWGTLEEWIARTGSAEHYPGVPYEWSVYDQQKDRYITWERNAPEVTLWLPRPKTPLAQRIDRDE